MLTDRGVDLREEDVDVAVRIAVVRDEALIARKLGAVRRVTVASPDYLARRGVPRLPHDVALHDTIQSEGHELGAPWAYQLDGRPVRVPIRPRLKINQADAAINAARAGRGLLTALSYQVAAPIAAGQLVRVLGEFDPPAIPVSLVYCDSRCSLRRLRLLADHLASRLRALQVIAE